MDKQTRFPGFDKTLELIRAGAFSEAVQRCHEIVGSGDMSPEILALCAKMAFQCKRVDLSIQWLETAVQMDTDRPDYLCQLARYHLASGDDRNAMTYFQMALQRQPNNTAALYQLGVIFSRQNETARAITCLKRALAIDPGHAEARNTLGSVYMRQRAFLQSRDCFLRVTEQENENWRAWGNLSAVLRELGELEAAKRCGERSLAINPRSFALWHNLGNVYREMDCFSDAVNCYQKALTQKTDSAATCTGLGIAHQRMGNRDAAVEAFETALAHAPSSAIAASNLFSIYRMEADWERAAIFEEKMHALTQDSLQHGSVPDEPPFLNLTRCDDPRLNLAVARSWSQEISRRLGATRKTLNFSNTRPLGKVIRIGYLSNNFGDHPTAHITRKLYALHDRSRFEVIVFSYGQADNSPYRKAIQSGCDRFVEIRSLSHTAAARAINENGIDILVDLVGFMKGERMSIAALRPAPVQVRWLGMAGTTGADFFDYLICDRTVTPESQQRFYTEKFIHLPYCYQINDNQPIVAETRPLRSAIGLPENGFVFCCFNTGYKIDATIFEIWMNILKRCPGSVLWVMAESERMERNLKTAARQSGVADSRLVFAPKVPKREHLSRLSLADLGLDTRMVNGAASTSDLLWAGVPVLTLQGRHFASRMSSSILRAVGLEQMITRSVEEYETLAVRLSQEKERLNRIKSNLARDLDRTALFDTKGFVTHLENAYSTVWNRYQDGKPPESITIDSVCPVFTPVG